MIAISLRVDVSQIAPPFLLLNLRENRAESYLNFYYLSTYINGTRSSKVANFKRGFVLMNMKTRWDMTCLKYLEMRIFMFYGNL